MALWIAVKALHSSRATPFVPLAHMQLTSSLPIIHRLFNPMEAFRTWRSSEFGLFSTESEEDRLNIGPVTLGADGPAFGIAREQQTATPLVMHSTPLQPGPGRPFSDDADDAETIEAQEGPDLPSTVDAAYRKGCVAKIFALSAAVIAVVITPAVFLAIYIFGLHQHHRHGLTLQTDAALSYVLATSQAISTVMSLAVPVVLTIHAYQLASDWLRASQDSGSCSRPSPLQ